MHRIGTAFALIANAMTLNDLAIIYLAAGSPFAVHRFLHLSASSLPARLASACAHLAVWPLQAAAVVGRLFAMRPAGATAGDDLDQIRSGFERALLDTLDDRSIFQYREVFDRYAGLALAVSSTSAIDENELFRVAGSKDPELSNVCLNRRNRKRLEFHHIQARNDFLAAVSKLSDEAAAENGIRDLAVRLAVLVRDGEAMRELEVIFPGQNGRKFSVSNTELEVWKPPTPNEPARSRI